MSADHAGVDEATAGARVWRLMSGATRDKSKLSRRGSHRNLALLPSYACWLDYGDYFCGRS